MNDINKEQIKELKEELEKTLNEYLGNGEIEKYTEVDLDLSVVVENLQSLKNTGALSDRFGLLLIFEKYKG